MRQTVFMSKGETEYRQPASLKIMDNTSKLRVWAGLSDIVSILGRFGYRRGLSTVWTGAKLCGIE